MKFSLFLLLLTIVTSTFLRRVEEEPVEEEEEEKEYNYNYGAIIVSEEQKMVVRRFIGKEDLAWQVREAAKNYEEMGEYFVENYGEVFKTLKIMGKTKMVSDINILNGLLGNKFDLFINRRVSTFKLYGETLEKFMKYCEETKLGKVGEWYKFSALYNDTAIPNQVNSLDALMYKRSDDKFDVIFISASQEFIIPPIKVPKEGVTITDKNKDDDKNYDITYPTEWNEKQNEAIQHWFNIVILKGICKLLEIEI